MNVLPTSLAGLVLLEPRAFADVRGYFLETWNSARYGAAGVPEHFVQDNVSYSTRGVVRGLHLQEPRGQGKLVSVLRGEIFDVAVDLRVGSATFGQWEGVTLSSENRRQFYLPSGFAHGFLVTGEDALVAYKCTAYYDPAAELSVRWDDPAIGVRWPAADYLLSSKDASAPRLADIPTDRLPALDAAPAV